MSQKINYKQLLYNMIIYAVNDSKMAFIMWEHRKLYNAIFRIVYIVMLHGVEKL